MKQVVINSFGPPSRVARVVDAPDVGPPSAWEVVVDIEAFPINPADLTMIAGQYGKVPALPSTIGMEAVGVVACAGESVTDLSVGDRVVLLANDNWAERRKVSASAVVKAPQGVDPLQLSMLKVNPATADCLLSRFETLHRGEWVLQNAPLSGVGRCVLQIAKARGLKTVNIVRRPEARGSVLAAGGDIVVMESDDLAARVGAATGGAPIRLALDAVAGAGAGSLASTLAQGGTLVNYGMLSGSPLEVSPEHTIFRGVQIKGFWVSRVLNALSLAERQELFARLGDLMSSGALTIPIDSVFPLVEIEAALRHAESDGRRGKVLVTTGEPKSPLLQPT